MGDRTYQVRTPTVVSEMIDGEVIAIHLTHGRYYSMDGTAAQIWERIERRQSLEAIQAHLIATCDAAEEEIRRAVAEFVDQLVAEDLVEVADEDAAHGSAEALSGDSAGTCGFEPPVLRRYTDMQDLLVLDPIHDVNEMGWPTAKTP